MKTAQNLLSANSLWRIFTASVIIAFSFLFFAFVSPTHALEKTTSSTPETFSNSYNSNSDVPANFHSVVQIVIVETLSAVNCQLTGYDSLSPNHKCLGVDPETGKVGFVENGGGAIASMGKLIDYTLTPPASSTQYMAYLKNNFGLAKPAYAAECTTAQRNENGVGFCSLVPLLEIWEAMRNIVYLLLILIFVIIGMGIMLRLHIDPRTVMTLQNQIPKIIVGILAITFSFAIAGFLIDIMWVSIYLFASTLSSAGGFLDGINLTAVTQATDPFAAVNAAYQDDFEIPGMSHQISSTFASLIVGFITPALGDILSGILGGIISILGAAIIFFAILILLIRLWIALILAYVYVILDVIFAPFFILAGLVPGSSLGLGSWLRDLIANLATFPMAISFILLGSYLMNVVSATNDTTSMLAPPLIGSTNPNAVAVLIGFGFLLMLPNMLSTMKAALKAPKMSFGPMMQPIGAAGGSLAGLPKRGMELNERYQYNRTENKWGRFKALTGNPLLRPGPKEPLKPSHGPGVPGAGGGSGH